MNCVVCSCDSQVWNAEQSAQDAAELLAICSSTWSAAL